MEVAQEHEDLLEQIVLILLQYFQDVGLQYLVSKGCSIPHNPGHKVSVLV